MYFLKTRTTGDDAKYEVDDNESTGDDTKTQVFAQISFTYACDHDRGVVRRLDKSRRNGC